MAVQIDEQALNERYKRILQTGWEQVESRCKKAVRPEWRKLRHSLESKETNSNASKTFAGIHLPEESDVAIYKICRLIADELEREGIKVKIKHHRITQFEHSNRSVPRQRYEVSFQLPWMEERSCFCFDKDGGESLERLIICLAFIEGAESVQEIADDPRYDDDFLYPKDVIDALEEELGMVRERSFDWDAEYPVARGGLSRKDLDARLSNLAATKSDYTPNNTMACCYAPAVGSLEKRKLKCDFCGADFTVAHYGSGLLIDRYDLFARNMRKSGYPARIDVYCPCCQERLGKKATYEFVFSSPEESIEHVAPLVSDGMSYDELGNCLDVSSLQIALEFLDGASSYKEIDERIFPDEFTTADELEDEIKRALGVDKDD